MKRATIEQLLSWGPCYGKAKIRELARGVESFTALDVLHREDISIEDRFWVVLRPELIEERILHVFACDCAEHVQPVNADPRSLNAIAVKRRWIVGQATDEELDAAWTAARAAVRAAAGAAAWAAAGKAAGDAAWTAAGDAAWAAAGKAAGDAERDWQIQRLLDLLQTSSDTRADDTGDTARLEGQWTHTKQKLPLDNAATIGKE